MSKAYRLRATQIFVAALCTVTTLVTYAQAPLVAHWPLTENTQDVSGNGLHATGHHVTFNAADGAHFDGEKAISKYRTPTP